MGENQFPLSATSNNPLAHLPLEHPVSVPHATAEGEAAADRYSTTSSSSATNVYSSSPISATVPPLVSTSITTQQGHGQVNSSGAKKHLPRGPHIFFRESPLSSSRSKQSTSTASSGSHQTELKAAKGCLSKAVAGWILAVGLLVVLAVVLTAWLSHATHMTAHSMIDENHKLRVENSELKRKVGEKDSLFAALNASEQQLRLNNSELQSKLSVLPGVLAERDSFRSLNYGLQLSRSNCELTLARVNASHTYMQLLEFKYRREIAELKSTLGARQQQVTALRVQLNGLMKSVHDCE